MAELRPSAAEVRERLARVAALTAEHRIDAVVVLDPANVYYLSGFRTTLHTRFAAVALRTSAPAEAMLIVPSVDQRLAQRPVWYPSLLERTEVYALGAAPGSAARGLEWLLDQTLRDGDVLGVDLAGASYGQVLQLTERYSGSRLVDASEILHAVRRVKSAFELEALRRAGPDPTARATQRWSASGRSRWRRTLRRPRNVSSPTASSPSPSDRPSPATRPTSCAPSSMASRPRSLSRAPAGRWRLRLPRLMR